MATAETRALWTAAKNRAAQLGNGATVKSVLEGLIVSQFNLSILNGRTVVSTTDAGGSVTFDFGGGLSPREFLTLVQTAIDELEAEPDPDDPRTASRPIRRLRTSFRYAQP